MIKLYPEPSTEEEIRKQHKLDCQKRRAKGLRPLSLSAWLSNLLASAKLWEHE